MLLRQLNLSVIATSVTDWKPKKNERYWILGRIRYARNRLDPERRRRAAERSKAHYRKTMKDPAKAAEVQARTKRYRLANHERCKFWRRDWELRNPEKHRLIRLNSARKKRASPAFRLRSNFRKRIRECLAGRGIRIGRLERALGYSMATLKAHIERQFKRGMTWDNWGRVWHIDHITPLAAYPHTSMGDQNFRVAWRLDNLRPIWAKDNIAKGAKITHLL